MSSFQKSIVLCSSLVVTWGCATIGLGQEHLQPTKRQPLSTMQAAPLSEYSLPYFGHGSVDIIDDGMLLIQLDGNEVALTHNNDAEQLLMGAVDAVIFKMNTAGLTIIEKNNEVFLDRNQRNLRERNLNINQVTQINFPKKEKLIEQKTRQALVSLTGTLEFDYDEFTGILYLDINDSRSGKSFSLEAPVVSFDQAGSNTNRSLEKNNNYSITLNTVDIADSTCSATCDKGSCSISCSGVCLAGCRSNGNPYCTCKGGVYDPGLPGDPPSD